MKITIPYLKPTVVGHRVTYGSTALIYSDPDRPNVYGYRILDQTSPIREIVPAQFTALDYDFKIAKRTLAFGASLGIIGLAVGFIPVAITVNAFVFLRETFRDTRDVLSVALDGLRSTLGAVVNPK